MALSTLSLGTLDVSTDANVEKFEKLSKKHSHYAFSQRFKKQVVYFKKRHFDIICLQEIRFEDNVQTVQELMFELGYDVYLFRNNQSKMSFHNAICVNKKSEWVKMQTTQYWTTYKDGVAMLSEDSNARVAKSEDPKIKGDEHGRCLGVALLRHRTSGKNILVGSAHVVSFFNDLTKQIQQEASLSLVKLAKDIAGKECPVIVAGDFNFFHGERILPEHKEWMSKIEKDFKMVELPLERMELLDEMFTQPDCIGTFNPWSTDNFSDTAYKQPMGHSKLDAIFASKSITCKDGVTVTPIVYQKLNDPKKMSQEEKDMGFNEIRYQIRDQLASDHFLLNANFQV